LRITRAAPYIRAILTDHVEVLEREKTGMTESEIGHALSHVDRSIETYIERCRRKIPSFVEGHFSLEQTWRLQRPSLWLDLFCAPVNSAWALPYIAVRKVTETLEKVGYSRLAQWARYIPPGLRTGYQVQIERLICAELLEWDRERAHAFLPQGFLKELQAVPALRKLIESEEFQATEREAARTLVSLLQQFSSGRAIVSDLSGALLTLVMSWSTFGSMSVSLRGIAYGVAKKNAHDRAASRFFLGKKVGSAFYKVFPPAVQEDKVLTILFLLGAGLTVGAMVCTILSDPIRKMLGFHRNRLEALVDEVEKELIVLSHKRIKRRLLE